MIQAAFKSQLGIIVKNISLAAVLVLGLSQTAKADEANKHQDLRISCDPAINQDSRLNCSFNNLPPEVEQNADTVAQGGRGRRRKSKVQGYYGGFALGAMFPTGGLELITDDSVDISSDIDYGTGFAGSVFGGIKFTEKFGAELEFLIGAGGGDTDDFSSEFSQELLDPTLQTVFDDEIDQDPDLADLPDGALDVAISSGYELDVDYTVFALYASPRFDLPISKKFTVFVSPGIGISQTNITTEENFDLDAEVDSNVFSDEQLESFNEEIDSFANDNPVEPTEVDLSKTGISFQIKAGAEYQISNAIEIFGQVRYTTLPTEDSDIYEVDNLNSFLGQAGLTFNF